MIHDKMPIDDKLVLHRDEVLVLMAKAFALPPIESEPEPVAEPTAPDREATPHVVPRPTGTSRRAVSPTERRVREAIAEAATRTCGRCGAKVARGLARTIGGVCHCPACVEAVAGRARGSFEAEMAAIRAANRRRAVPLVERARAYLERVAAQNCPEQVP